MSALARTILVLLIASGTTAAQEPPAPGSRSSARAWIADDESIALAVLERARAQGEALRSRTRDESGRIEPPSGVRLFNPLASAAGPVWTDLGTGDAAPGRVVLLVHGLDEPGDIWDDLAPALAAAGYTVARFEYPNDQQLAPSAELLTRWLRTLRSAGAARVDLICHSMGGLVAREALTRSDLYAGQTRGHEDMPDIDRLILLGTPSGGSPWTGMEAVAEAREELVRFSDDPDWRHLFGLFREGRGGAADDLTPGSAFLKDLDARGWPPGLAVTAVVGRIVPATSGIREELGARLGDGVVPVASATPAGVADVVPVGANHRGIVRYGPTERAARELAGQADLTPPAIPIVLDRLAREKAE